MLASLISNIWHSYIPFHGGLLNGNTNDENGL